ncbi:MAG TPA: PaaI family thioesterase [Blastocatellia bacterium]|nr:PaaI family thioesterase [Blastocatellia bacterium]
MESRLAVTRDDLSRILSGSPFARIYNLRLDSFGSGECTLVMPFDEALERPGGIVSGSVLMTAADAAMWLAIMTRLGKDAMTVTTGMTTAFLKPARKEDVHCTARILKLGKKLVYGVAECSGDAGSLISHHTITYAVMDPR